MDLSDPLTRGLFDLTSGRLPRSEGEVVVNQSVLDKGYRVGDALELTADDAPADPTIVGVAESTTVRTFPVAAGPLGALRGRRGQQHLVAGRRGPRSRGRRCASSTTSAPSWPRVR